MARGCGSFAADVERRDRMPKPVEARKKKTIANEEAAKIEDSNPPLFPIRLRSGTCRTECFQAFSSAKLKPSSDNDLSRFRRMPRSTSASRSEAAAIQSKSAASDILVSWV